MDKVTKFVHNIKVLFDQTAWLLIAPVLLVLWMVDSSMIKTIVQWTVLAAALCGFAVVLSRIMLPQVRLTELVEKAKESALPAAVVVLGVLIFLGFLVVALSMWAKP